MKTDKMKTGARLMARWPDTNFYYWCTLIDKVGERWKIQFDDGTLAEVTQSDLHESLPPDAHNIVGRVTRSSPTKLAMRGSPTKQIIRGSPAKHRKRPEETRKSPARKVRKLFTEEDNIKLGAELIDLEESAPASGNVDVRPSLPERSVSVPKEAEDLKQSALEVRPVSREKSLSVSKETEDASSVYTSEFKKSSNVASETRDVRRDASEIQSSEFNKSFSAPRDIRDVTHAATDVRSSPIRRSVSITKETEHTPHGAADVRHSPLKSSYAVDVQKERRTHSVTKYTESYMDRDSGRRLLREGSIGAADLRSSPLRLNNPSPLRLNNPIHKRENVTRGTADLRFFPLRSSNPPHETQNVTQDVKSYVDSYLDSDFRRQQLKKGSTIGLADLRQSPSRGSDMLVNERGTLMSDLRKHTELGLDREFWKKLGSEGSTESTKYTESYLDRDFRKQLKRDCSVGYSGIESSPYRRSISLTKDDKQFMSGTSRYTLEDYEKKHLKKYPLEFGGRLGVVLLILLLPLYITSVFVFKLVPDPKKFEISIPKQLVLLPQVGFSLMLFMFLQAVLSIVPIGAIASGPLTKIGILTMRCNGVFAFAITLVLTLSACYYEKEVPNIVVSLYTEAAVSAVFLGIIFSLILYKRAHRLPLSYLNPYGATGYKLYDLWMGRELTPRIGKFNIKLILHRFSKIIAITLNILIVTEAYFQGEEGDLLKSLMISTVVQSLYCLHFLFHEDIYLYSFLAISEGVGYMSTVGLMTFPFMLTFTTKVILDYRLKASLTEICIALSAYIVGHLFLELSNWEETFSVRDPITSVWKMKFQPFWNPKIQTRAYLGQIMIYWGFAMVAGTTYLGIFIIPAGFTVAVVSRAVREYMRCAAHQRVEVYVGH
uniref:Tudor domain-containing protein Tdr16 n=1 Tax=Locusta migratoria TaxID=7004 RepID=A0AAU7J9A5_LOCMI